MTYPPISELVPHGPPIRALDELLEWEEGRALCRMEVREDSLFVVDGELDTIVTIEHMAQAVATCLGYQAFLGGEGARVGMIIGCRKMTIARPTLAVGDVVSVEAKKLRGNETVSRFGCEVFDDAGVIATADMTLYHAEEPPG